ncbi:hypothetical protein DFH07DRAFT_297076 [Mycena maculata]|uniref:Uncharacterized protein n=1 Tax=Mycena maculata TaxID=230809 RepID=A0AAD7MLI0_9AGAR|nr:hypothetical protein DFH07DRAFT_297076 [Mycena maculata]
MILPHTPSCTKMSCVSVRRMYIPARPKFCTAHAAPVATHPSPACHIFLVPTSAKCCSLVDVQSVYPYGSPPAHQIRRTPSNAARVGSFLLPPGPPHRGRSPFTLPLDISRRGMGRLLAPPLSAGASLLATCHKGARVMLAGVDRDILSARAVGPGGSDELTFRKTCAALRTAPASGGAGKGCGVIDGVRRCEFGWSLRASASHSAPPLSVHLQRCTLAAKDAPEDGVKWAYISRHPDYVSDVMRARATQHDSRRKLSVRCFHPLPCPRTLKLESRSPHDPQPSTAAAGEAHYLPARRAPSSAALAIVVSSYIFVFARAHRSRDPSCPSRVFTPSIPHIHYALSPPAL